ncbi:MAG: WD40 repeat domain-containing serine/threonine protein kinase [Planctomycetota bacterium]
MALVEADWSFGDDVPAGTPERAPSDSGFIRRGELGAGMVLGGRFQVRGTLGRGGMGVVYRAYDLQSEREVALKLLARSAERATLERFRREGELTAALRHPGIVSIHSGGELDGQPYLAYELVPESRTLEQVLPTLPLPERVQMLVRVAQAVAYAHERGVVHRDLKPPNVLVTPLGAPLVADFGLASGRDLERLTKSGTMIGTPSYMAPELITGDREQIGPHTDVWALGVMLYEALTGELPFQGGSLLELAATIMRDDPVPPRQRVKEVSPALEAVCLMAMRREGAERYPDAGALAADLEAALAGGKISASTSTGFERALGSLRRPLALAPLALVLLGALGLLAWAVGRRAPAPSPSPGAAGRPASGPPRADEAQAALAAARGLADPRARLLALEAWLDRNPGHRARTEALASLRSLAPRVPLLHLRAADEQALLFLDEDHLLVQTPQALEEWQVSGDGQAPRWRQELAAGGGRALERSARGALAALAAERCWLGAPRALEVLPFRGVRCFAFDAAGERLAIAAGAEVHLVGVADRQVRVSYPSPRLPVWSLVWAPDGAELAATIGDKGGPALCVWDLSVGPRAEPRIAPLDMNDPLLSISADGRSLLTGDRAGSLWVFDRATLERQGAYESPTIRGTVSMSRGMGHPGQIRAMLPLPDGRLLTTGSSTRGFVSDVALWDREWRELGRYLPSVDEERYRALALSPARSRIAIAGQVSVGVWDAWFLR